MAELPPITELTSMGFLSAQSRSKFVHRRCSSARHFVRQYSAVGAPERASAVLGLPRLVRSRRRHQRSHHLHRHSRRQSRGRLVREHVAASVKSTGRRWYGWNRRWNRRWHRRWRAQRISSRLVIPVSGGRSRRTVRDDECCREGERGHGLRAVSTGLEAVFSFENVDAARRRRPHGQFSSIPGRRRVARNHCR